MAVHLHALGHCECEWLDRNWSSLLKELRGRAQVWRQLTGFLPKLPVQKGFDRLEVRDVYVATVPCSVAAAVAPIAPVAMHSLLLRLQSASKAVLVSAGHGGVDDATLGSAVAGLSLSRCASPAESSRARFAGGANAAGSPIAFGQTRRPRSRHRLRPLRPAPTVPASRCPQWR